MTVVGDATKISHYNGGATGAAFATRATLDLAMIDQSSAFVQDDSSASAAAIAEKRAGATAVSTNDGGGTFDRCGSGVLKNQTGPTPAARPFSAS
jgi:hypothetical protein